MLTKTDWKSVPPYGRESRSPIRQFAYRTVMEFLESAEEGDVFEVTGFPQMEGDDAIRMAEKVRSAMRTELWYLNKEKDLRREVNIFRRKERLFIERKEPWRAPQGNPYPGELPRVH